MKVVWLKLKLFYVSFRSDASGNCLYSSVSLALVGDNSLSSELRILTSLELYFHADFYCKHSCLSFVFKEHQSHFAAFCTVRFKYVFITQDS